MSLMNTLKALLISLPVQFTTSYPTLLLAFLSLPYKLLVFTVTKFFRPDLISFVHGMSAWFTVDSIHSRPANTLTYFVILDGVITLERFQHLFQQKVLNKRESVCENDGSRKSRSNSRALLEELVHVENKKRDSLNGASAKRRRQRFLMKRESTYSGTFGSQDRDEDWFSSSTSSDLSIASSISTTTTTTTNSSDSLPKHGPLIYAKLRQYWTNFMGYNFWKWDDNFDINNHINVYDYKSSNFPKPSSTRISKSDVENVDTHTVNYNEDFKKDRSGKFQIYDKSDLANIKRHLLSKPFKKDQSPWEFLLLYNYYENCEVQNEKPESESEGDKMILILRIHHALADGYSLLQALQHDLPGRRTPLAIARPNYVNKTLANQIFNVLLCPYEIAKIYRDSIDRRNEWNYIFPFGGRPSWKYYTSLTNPIRVEKVKEIKAKFGVCYLSVMMTAVCGGIRRAMVEAGQSVPSHISFVCPLPKQDHPGGLVNHMKTTTIVLPMGEMSTVERQRIIDDQIRYEKTTMLRYVLTTYYELWGFLPTCLLKLQKKCHLIPSFLVSNFPVPEQTTVIDGCPVSDFYVGYGHGFMNWGATIMMFGDGGKQSVVVSTDQNSYPSQEKFHNLGGYIEEELEILAKSLPQQQ